MQNISFSDINSAHFEKLKLPKWVNSISGSLKNYQSIPLLGQQFYLFIG